MKARAIAKRLGARQTRMSAPPLRFGALGRGATTTGKPEGLPVARERGESGAKLRATAGAFRKSVVARDSGVSLAEASPTRNTKRPSSLPSPTSGWGGGAECDFGRSREKEEGLWRAREGWVEAKATGKPEGLAVQPVRGFVGGTLGLGQTRMSAPPGKRVMVVPRLRSARWGG